MILPVVWIPEANEDLLDARAWYEKIRPQLGQRFAAAVEVTIEAIAERPAIPDCPPGPPTRWSAALSLRDIIRGSGASGRDNRLLPWQAQSEALAPALICDV